MPTNNPRHPGTRYAVVHEPTADTSPLQAIRERYDPTAALIGPHVTLVFPFSAESVDERYLIDHVSSCTQRFNPFDAHFSDTELSWDQWLFLVPNAGREQLIRLHDVLYTGPLRPLLRPDIPFVPHISLAYLGTHQGGPDLADPVGTTLDHDRYRSVLGHVSMMNLHHAFTVDEVQLVAVSANFDSTSVVRSIKLGGSPPSTTESG